MLLLLQLNDERTNFYVCMEMNNVYTTHPTTARERNIAGVPFILSKLSTQRKNDKIPKQNFIISVFVRLCSLIPHTTLPPMPLSYFCLHRWFSFGNSNARYFDSRMRWKFCVVRRNKADNILSTQIFCTVTIELINENEAPQLRLSISVWRILSVTGNKKEHYRGWVPIKAFLFPKVL